ncbi:hypothetical protein LXL04_021393 [Taraxacum kok-saghyz]
MINSKEINLQMYFPPSLFDVMVYLISHILNEIKYCGLVLLRYMYPFERYMGVLKGYDIIFEGYTTEEVLEYRTDCLQCVMSIGLPDISTRG